MKSLRVLFIALTCAALVGPVQAQLAEKKALTLEGAKKVIAAAVEEAKKDSSGGVIAVVDDGGNLICLERLDNTFAAGANISIGKARTAAIFKRPTKAFEEIIKNGRTAMVALNDFTPLQGGEPITYEGQIIGAVGVSGAKSADRDEEMALTAANAFAMIAKGKTDPPTPAVIYYDKDTVAASFARGAILFDGNNDRNYMVHTSKREQAGMAEIHTLDADVIYVLDGTATFITGGTIVDPKTTAPNEIRGTAILNGETRHLKKGDVIIVARNTPHWFQQIDGTFHYFVVKVR